MVLRIGLLFSPVIQTAVKRLLGPPTKFTTLVHAPPGLPAARVMEQLAEAGGGLPAHLQEVRLHAYHSSGA